MRSGGGASSSSGVSLSSHDARTRACSAVRMNPPPWPPLGPTMLTAMRADSRNDVTWTVDPPERGMIHPSAL